MKIAVFGDSFAAAWPNETTDNLCWATILKTFGYTIDNYAVKGSSLYYSWKKFKTCDLNQYDKIVFVETHWDRYFLPHISNNKRLQHIPSIDRIDSLYDSCGIIEKSVLSAVKQHWILVNQDDQKKDLHQLMLKDLVLSRPDILIIPAFRVSSGRPFGYKAIGCFAPGRSLSEFGGVDLKDENVANHLSTKYRIKLAKLIHKWILTGDFTLEE